MAEETNKPNRLFLTCNQGLVHKDARFFRMELNRLLDLYTATKVESKDELGAKIVCMSALIGLATGMMEHFSVGLDTLKDSVTNDITYTLAIMCAKKTLQKVQAHTDSMAAETDKAAN